MTRGLAERLRTATAPSTSGLPHSPPQGFDLECAGSACAAEAELQHSKMPGPARPFLSACDHENAPASTSWRCDAVEGDLEREEVQVLLDLPPRQNDRAAA